jgi:hypothetical protein
VRDMIRTIEQDGAISVYAYLLIDNQWVEFVTVNLSALSFLKDIHADYHVEKLVDVISNYYGLEVKEMVVLNPGLPCKPDEEYLVTCKNNNIFCYLFREWYPQTSNAGGISICKSVLADKILATIVQEKLVKALAKYAIEQLQIDKPVIIIMTDGFYKVIAIATKQIHQ